MKIFEMPTHQTAGTTPSMNVVDQEETAQTEAEALKYESVRVYYLGRFHDPSKLKVWEPLNNCANVEEGIRRLRDILAADSGATNFKTEAIAYDILENEFNERAYPELLGITLAEFLARTPDLIVYWYDNRKMVRPRDRPARPPS